MSHIWALQPDEMNPSSTLQGLCEENCGENAKTVEENCGENTGTVEKILTAIKNNPTITQKQLADVTGLTRRGIEWQLKQLKLKKMIRRVGPDKGGHWEILQSQDIQEDGKK